MLRLLVCVSRGGLFLGDCTWDPSIALPALCVSSRHG